MKIYKTPQKDEGLSYPYSGPLLGWLTEGLGLKTWLYEELEEQKNLSSKTLQRYFKGEFVQDQKTIDAIADLFIEQLFLDTKGAFGVTTLVWTAALKNILTEWDILASELNARSFPLHARGDQFLVAMRLLLPEIACRAGVVLCLRQISLGISVDKNLFFDKKLFSKEIIGFYIDLFKIKDETIEDFAERCSVSTQTVYGWKSGIHLPSDKIENLAKILIANRVPDEEYKYWFETMTIELRFYRFIAWFFEKLELLIGEYFFETISDTLYGLLNASYLNFIHLLRSSKENRFFTVTGDLLIRGTKSYAYPTWVKTTREALENLHTIIKNFQPKVFSDRFQEDLLAWACERPLRFERLQYWVAKIGSIHEETSSTKKEQELLLRQINNMSSKEDKSDEISADFLNIINNMPDFILSPYYRFFENKPDQKAIICQIHIPVQFGGALQRAERLRVQGDLLGAIAVLRASVKAMPNEPYHHFTLGSAISDAIVLNIQRGQGLDISMYTEGKKAIERAILLAPEDGIFANELGVFLSRSDMSEAAEKAFADAEKLAGELSLYWFGRGVNLLKLGEHRRGQQYIKKSLDYARDGKHADAYMFLSILHTIYGNRQDAQRYGWRAEQLGQPNPHSWGREKCIYWLKCQKMWPPKDDV